MSDDLQGQCSRQFAEVEEALRGFLARGEELGVSVCVWHRGHKVVDLWGGFADRKRKRPWRESTLTTIFSATKGMVALCFLILADRGKLDYDQPVAHYWPEFAAAGKSQVSVRSLLNHRAGLIAIDTPLRLVDFEKRPDWIAEVLARQAPLWRPGSDQGYHGVTFGLYAGELFRRIAGESLGSFLHREVSQPLGVDLFLGLPEAEEERVAAVVPGGSREIFRHYLPAIMSGEGVDGRVFRRVLMRGDSGRAFANPAEIGPRGVVKFNTARVHRLELPWANAISNARGLARVYAALARRGRGGGPRLVSPSAIEPLLSPQSFSEMDRVLCKPVGWSQGFIKEEADMFSPNAASFGHPGAGGVLGWCDPSEDLAFAYVPNRMAPNVRSPRARALAAAIYRCV